YRGLDTTAGVVSAPIAAQNSATTSFSCPGVQLRTYSDLYLGIVVGHSPTATTTVPSGATERVDAQMSANGGAHIAVFDVHMNAVVNTGVQTATLSVASTGLAIGLALAKSHDAIPDPRDSTVLKTGDWTAILAYVPILLDRARISHRELIQLL